MWREIYFKVVRTCDTKMYFVNSEWTTEYFINTLREKVKQDFQIDYCEFIDTANRLPEGIPAEDGPAITTSSQTLIQKYGDSFFHIAFYIRPIEINNISLILPNQEIQIEPLLNNRMCVVCFNEERNVVFTPCNHLCVCSSCDYTNRIYYCPICRASILTRMTIYV
jgi:hypothetical protein